MAEKLTRSQSKSGHLKGGADYVALGLIAVTAITLAALALSGVSLRSAENSSPPSRSSSHLLSTPQPSVSPTPTVEPPVGLSFLGDNSGLAQGSWWTSSVTAGRVPGVIENVDPFLLSTATDVTVSDLQRSVDGVSTLSGYVVVQGGTTDLVEGAEPADIAANLQMLWQSVADRGGKPIVALTPPSNEYRSEVIALNGLLQAAGEADGFVVLDLYSPVAAPDGSWADVYSDDGVGANAAASQLLAQVAIAQLPQMTSNS